MVAVRLENVVCRHTLKRGETHARAPGGDRRAFGGGARPACARPAPMGALWRGGGARLRLSRSRR